MTLVTPILRWKNEASGELILDELSKNVRFWGESSSTVHVLCSLYLAPHYRPLTMGVTSSMLCGRVRLGWREGGSGLSILPELIS